MINIVGFNWQVNALNTGWCDEDRPWSNYIFCGAGPVVLDFPAQMIQPAFPHQNFRRVNLLVKVKVAVFENRRC